MALLDTRLAFLPFEYNEASEYFERQQEAHWLWKEINLTSDISDWHSKLTETEKNVIAGVLKGFTQTEVLVNDYWTNKVFKWFKKPEIQMMASTFGSFEAIHARSYSVLNETLGLNDFEAFLYDPSTKAKIDNIIGRNSKSKKDMALSLAVFSAFTEGVSLFSSFAILLNFSRFNKMKGMGQIISLSIRDESIHSRAGCWLFRTFIHEYPEVFTDELKAQIVDSARDVVKLEDDFIDSVFKHGTIEGLDPEDLKQYIRHRANAKLGDLGLGSNWKTLNKDAVRRITEWFDLLSAGVEMQDFFSLRPTTYAKATVDWSKTFT